MAQLFVTDFDGVICDSVSECLLAADNAWRKFQKGENSQRIFDIHEIPEDRRSRFRQLRPYLRGAEDFIPLYLAAEESLKIESQGEFDALRNRLLGKLPAYQQAFYGERDFLRQHHRELWLQLNPLFSNVGRALGLRESFEEVYILTTKRRPDVEDIFKYHGIRFPADHIHAVASNGKMERLRSIMETAGVSPAGTVYIEDQIDYLISAAPMGVEVYLAEWGYVSDEQRRVSEEKQIPVLSQGKFGELLQNALKR